MIAGLGLSRCTGYENWGILLMKRGEDFFRESGAAAGICQ